MLSAHSVIAGHPGYLVYKPSDTRDLIFIRDTINQSYIKTMIAHAPAEHHKSIADAGVENYHTYSKFIDHSIWNNLEKRTFPTHGVAELYRGELFCHLRDQFGDFDLADAYNQGRKDVYWRLVRPNEPSDVGSLHADSWFWKIDDLKMDSTLERVKVWIAIFCEPGLNGLFVLPNSHLKTDWKWGVTEKGGRKKPVFLEEQSTLHIELLNTKPGEAVIFNDDLIHGGAVNQGYKTRVSIEMTLLVKKI